MNKVTFAALLLAACPAIAQLILPWHQDDADHRTVYEITSAHSQTNAQITLPIGCPQKNINIVDARNPQTPLAVYFETNSCTLLLPGTVSHQTPRHLIAYSGGSLISPQQTRKPLSQSDYASTVLKCSWTFDDIKTCGTITWNAPSYYSGPITTKDGWLQIPVKGTDPYFIFGNMWGAPDSKQNLHIDSSIYRHLTLRVRQSCKSAQWSLFVTDRNGRHTHIDFDVHGTNAHTFNFDLKTLLPDFWDGREFKAIRIDPTNDSPDTLAEVNYILLLPDNPTVTSGPLFSKAAVKARNGITKIKCELPQTVTAGEPLKTEVKLYGELKTACLLWSFQSPQHGNTIVESLPGCVNLPVLTNAGVQLWTLGLADDMGNPYTPAKGNCLVKPAGLIPFSSMQPAGLSHLTRNSISLRAASTPTGRTKSIRMTASASLLIFSPADLKLIARDFPGRLKLSPLLRST